jgi:Transposase, Mutator family
MQTALEAEVEEFLGRARYQRRTKQDRPGSRNGWQPPAAVKTTMGPVELQRPKLRGTDEAFCSRLFGAGVTRAKGALLRREGLYSSLISEWRRARDRGAIQALAKPAAKPSCIAGLRRRSTSARSSWSKTKQRSSCARDGGPLY